MTSPPAIHVNNGTMKLPRCVADEADEANIPWDDMVTANLAAAASTSTERVC